MKTIVIPQHETRDKPFLKAIHHQVADSICRLMRRGRAAVLLLHVALGLLVGPAFAQTATTTVLTSGTNPSVVAQSVTLTATVTGSTPTGTVTFKDGAATIGTGTISSGTATLVTSFAAKASHSLTAVYAGNANNLASTSAVRTQTVNARTTTTVLTSGINPAVVGQGVTLTATVTGTNATGNVTFKDGTTTIGTSAVTAGVATLATSFSTKASHSLKAVYAGDTNNLTSTSATVVETVNARTTTTVLTSGANPAPVAQAVTLTATVTGTNVTGNVTFKDGATTLGTGAVTAGVATFAATFATSGTHSLTAVYAGNTNNLTSTSAAVVETVTARASTTVLTSSVNPANVGQSTTLTATITATGPTGSVTFKDGAATLGTGTVSAGKATFAATFATAGSHSLTAVYAGDANNATSTSAAITETVNARTTTTVLASSANPANLGQGVTLTANVTGTNATGVVTFKDGAATLGTGTVAAGSATYVATFGTVGSHSLTAVYGGDANNATSTSAALSETVSAATSTTLLTTSANPVAVGQAVTLIGTVTGSGPTGTVTFFDGAATLGTGTLSAGQATYIATFGATGGHNLTATYSGDGNNAGSSSGGVIETVNASSSSTTLAVTPNPAGAGRNVTMTATIVGSNPTGYVNFLNGGSQITQVPVSAGKAILAWTFGPGTLALSAAYQGDSNNLASTSATVNETVQLNATITSLVISPTSVSLGQAVTVTVTTTGYVETGSDSVYVMDGASYLGGGALNASGVYSFSTTFNAPGNHSLVATFGGNGYNAASSSATVVEAVTLSATTTSLAINPNPVINGGTATLTATVTGSGPTGIVTFKDGGSVIGTGVLIGNAASLDYQFTSAGDHSITATFGGDSSNAASTSTAVIEKVTAVTTTALTSAANPVALGQAVLLTGTVTGASPTGAITFKDGNSTLGTSPMAGGVATYSATFATLGSHSLTATYSGDANNAVSTSPSFVETLVGSASTTSVASSRNPAFVGQNVTLSAAVTGTSPTGSVTFMDGATALGSVSLVSGNASMAVSFGAAGAHGVTAVYGGDASNTSSTSAVLTQTVDSKVASSTVLASGSNPGPAGQSITLTATVTGSSPTGMVTFKDGATTLGSASLSAGAASVAVNFETAGAHSLVALYAGDSANQASSSVELVQTVGPAPTTTTLSAPSTATAGQSVSLYVTVTSNLTHGGTVTFKDGSTVLGTADLVNGYSAGITTAFISGGNHSLTAEYGGDANNAVSTSNARIVAVSATSSTTVLTASANPAALGQAIVLSASISGASPSGSVTFKDGATVLGTSPVSGGVATLGTNFSTVGSHSLTASYSGDSGNSTSSGAMTEVVKTNAGGVSLSAGPNPALVGQSISMVAVVTGSAPTGTVEFRDGSNSLGVANVVSGSAALSTSFQLNGTSHTLTANYAGDANNTSAVSAAVVVQVGSAPPPDGNMTWTYRYDSQGNRTSVQDPNGNLTSTTYDALQRTAAINQPPPVVPGPSPAITYSYDGQDAVKTIKDPRNLTTTYNVDGLGNLKTTTSPDTGAASATHDAGGNVLTRTDSRGKTTTYAYDALNRVTSVGYATGTGTVFEYDGGASPQPGSIGHLTKMTDESGVTTFVYDTLGRLLTRTQIVAGKTLTVSYTWGSTGSATGKVTSITYPSGARVNYAYDNAGRQNALTVNPPNSNGVGTNVGAYMNLLAGITYNAENNLLGWTWANGAPYQRTYDTFGRLASYPLGYPLGTGIAAGLTRNLAYDNAGRITATSHVNSGGGQVAFDQGFGYDGLDRLINQNAAGLNYGFGFDITGNRTSRNLGATAYVNTVDPGSNRLTQVQTAGTSGTVTTPLTYDAAGNVSSDEVAAYVYSDRGRMSSATVGGSTINYFYNGLEQRVRKAGALISTGVSHYAYDQAGQLLGEYDANLASISETIYIDDTPIAVLKQVGSAATSTLQLSVGNVYADHQNTPRVITRNTDEAILWRWDGAEIFGASVPLDNPNSLGAYKFNQRFPGQIYDTETGNFSNGYRDYRPSTGRYIQSDPIGLEGGINTYAYVGGNPLGYTDPTGLAAAGALLGGKIGEAVGSRFGLPGRTLGRAVGSAAGSAIEDLCRPDDHRGRIQAQGSGYEDSEAWAKSSPLTAVEGLAGLEILISRMPPKIRKARLFAIEAAKKWIARAAVAGGVSTPPKVSMSFVEPGSASDRIDIEVITGRAFTP